MGGWVAPVPVLLLVDTTFSMSQAEKDWFLKNLFYNLRLEEAYECRACASLVVDREQHAIWHGFICRKDCPDRYTPTMCKNRRCPLC